jgi:hypothetical protein
MPKELEERVKKIMKSGTPRATAYAIATKQLQKAGVLKKGTNKKK